MHEISIPYTVISSAARNLFRFPPPSLSLLGEAPSPPFLRYSVSHFSLSGTLPLTANEKDPSASLGMTLRKWRFPNISFIRDVGYLFPPLPSFRAQARNPPCTLFFLAPFAEGFQFYFVTHTTLYRCARKIEGFGRDDVAEAAFSQHILYTERGLSIPPLPSFRAQREIFFVPLFHDSFAKPFTGSTTYRLSCEKDPSAPLGMTIREKCFLSTAFAGYVG